MPRQARCARTVWRWPISVRKDAFVTWKLGAGTEMGRWKILPEKIFTLVSPANFPLTKIKSHAFCDSPEKSHYRQLRSSRPSDRRSFP
jgi:hypothetical protein